MSRVSFSPSSATAAKGVLWTQLYLGLGFTTLATLMLELSLTRIFSVVFYYHFAFLAISIALFGLGAGGVFSYVVSGWRGNLYSKLGALGIANSLCVVASLWFILSRPAGILSNFTLAMVYLASALPFFLAGTVVSIAIAEAIERVDRAYFFDLGGAAVGCLLLIPFLHLFGGPNTVIAAAVIYAVAAAIWFHQAAAQTGKGVRRRATAVLLGLVLVMFMVANGKGQWIDVRTAKGQNLPPESFHKWNSFSRIAVTHFDVSWEKGAYYTIIIDGDAGTGISQFDWDKGLTDEERFQLLHEGSGFPYALHPGSKSLIIGPGGGWDIARALASGSHDITAVEINPIIANDVMRGVMLDTSHRIYMQPGVKVHISDGRSFVRGTSEKYQVIQATLVDTWASTAAGAFALSENNLYTSDAFYDYLQHLTDDGVLALTRWGFDPPRESLRLVTLGMDALSRLGETDPARHVIAIRQSSSEVNKYGALDTVLISRKAFTAEDLTRARQIASDGKLDTVYLPGDAPKNPFGQLLDAPNEQAFLDSYRYNVSSVSDDRPFFFYTVQPRDLWDYFLHADTASEDYKINRAVPLLFGVVGISIAATALILLLPRWLLGARLPRKEGVMGFLWYFLCLGAAYILVQVALIQKFVLLLGQPTYALTVIVFSMLVASGLGSFFSSKIVGANDSRLMTVLGLIAILIGVVAISARPFVVAAAAWPIQAKIAAILLFVAPPAFFMGIPFPTGLRRLEQLHPPSVRWAWSLNAAASVLGSAGAIFLAIYLGLRATLLIGGFLYLIALLVIKMSSNPDARTEANTR